MVLFSYRIFCTNGKKPIFPNLYMGFKIALTLPVGSVQTERSFSKLKIIKNRLRSTMANDRLESLMIISCEHDIDVDYDYVINKFKQSSPLLMTSLTL